MRYLLLFFLFAVQTTVLGYNTNDLKKSDVKKVLTLKKSSLEARSNVLFRYQGMYFDEETGLCYNRHRYYSPDTGTYISQDPIGLAGGMPNMYAYVADSNNSFDPFGLMPLRTVDFAGSSDLFPTTGSQKNIVTIKMQGSRGRDFTQAFKEAGIDKKLAGDYTWHHMADFNPKTGTTTMQLVKTDAHEAIRHRGSVSQFKKFFKIKDYTNKGGAVDIAKKKGWIKCK